MSDSVSPESPKAAEVTFTVPDYGNSELTAMHLVLTVLRRLDDPHAASRVMRWVEDRYGSEVDGDA
jgi:hypothetical protein